MFYQNMGCCFKKINIYQNSLIHHNNWGLILKMCIKQAKYWNYLSLCSFFFHLLLELEDLRSVRFIIYINNGLICLNNRKWTRRMAQNLRTLPNNLSHTRILGRFMLHGPDYVVFCWNFAMSLMWCIRYISVNHISFDLF